jgi:hypothetical protein
MIVSSPLQCRRGFGPSRHVRCGVQVLLVLLLLPLDRGGRPRRARFSRRRRGENAEDRHLRFTQCLRAKRCCAGAVRTSQGACCQGLAAQACPKFEESQRLDPGVGTQFNLADCYERTGRLASAYTTFIDVAAATRQLGQFEREAVARERAKSIKPRLSRLVIVVDRKNAPQGIIIRKPDPFPEVGSARCTQGFAHSARVVPALTPLLPRRFSRVRGICRHSEPTTSRYR